jgi:type III secretory pathway lipoprotein EscJ
MRTGLAAVFILTAFIPLSCAYDTNPHEPPVQEQASGNSSFFPSYQEIRAMKEQQLARDIEKTISGFKGVKRVDVHISLKDTRVTASRGATHSKAAVVLWMRKSSSAEVEKIKSVVAASSVDLEKEYIDVIQNDASLLKEHVARIPGRGGNYRLLLIMALILCLSGAFGIFIVGLRGRLAQKKQKQDKSSNSVERH